MGLFKRMEAQRDGDLQAPEAGPVFWPPILTITERQAIQAVIEWLRLRGVYVDDEPKHRTLLALLGEQGIQAGATKAARVKFLWRIGVLLSQGATPKAIMAAKYEAGGVRGPRRKRLKKPRGSKSVVAKYPGWAASDAFLESFEWRRLRMQVLKKYGSRCMCCGATSDDGVKIHVDHIKPRRMHPELALDAGNLQVLCEACNHGKGNWDETDWRPDR